MYLENLDEKGNKRRNGCKQQEIKLKIYSWELLLSDIKEFRAGPHEDLKTKALMGKEKGQIIVQSTNKE